MQNVHIGTCITRPWPTCTAVIHPVRFVAARSFSATVDLLVLQPTRTLKTSRRKTRRRSRADSWNVSLIFSFSLFFFFLFRRYKMSLILTWKYRESNDFLCKFSSRPNKPQSVFRVTFICVNFRHLWCLSFLLCFLMLSTVYHILWWINTRIYCSNFGLAGGF